MPLMMFIILRLCFIVNVLNQHQGKNLRVNGGGGGNCTSGCPSHTALSLQVNFHVSPHLHSGVFLQVSKIDVEKIQITALKGIIDCLHLYGIEEFAEATEDLLETLIVPSPGNEKNKEACIEEGGAIITALCDVSIIIFPTVI